jgi:3-oxoacyl-[acyl-carrier-protein] synthase III
MSTPIKAALLATGAYLPSKRLTNADLEKMVETTDEWIVQRTGIRERRIAGVEETTSDMCLKAAQNALQKAGMTADEIDMIVVATVSPDTPMPSTACWLQKKLGAPRCPAFDLSAACSGFLYGLSVSKAWVENGAYRRILLVGAEKLSAFMDWSDRGTCVLFGDGAGAAVIGPSEGAGGEILSVYLSANGEDADLLTIPAGGSRLPASRDTTDGKMHSIKMQGKEVFKIAVKVMAEAVQHSLRAAELDVNKLDWLIPHQANLRIITALADRLKFPMERVFLNVEKTGNTSAASVIIALDEAVSMNRIQRGQTVGMVAFGAGTTLGSTIVRW